MVENLSLDLAFDPIDSAFCFTDTVSPFEDIQQQHCRLLEVDLRVAALEVSCSQEILDMSFEHR
jgi:hypothetical protein